MRPSIVKRHLSILPLLAVLLLALGSGTAQAAKGDRNRDGIPDRWEKRHKLSLKVRQANRDTDRDGVRNICEYRAKTNPRKRDSNRNGIRDAYEDRDRDGATNGEESRERTDCGRWDFDQTDLWEAIMGEVAWFDPVTRELSVELLDGEGFFTAPLAKNAQVWCVSWDDEIEEDPEGEGPEGPLTEEQWMALYGDGAEFDDEEDEGGDLDYPTDVSLCSTDELVPGQVVNKVFVERGKIVKVRLLL